MTLTARSALALLIAANVLWAGSYVAGKEALTALSPIELNGLRFGVAGLLVAPFLWRSWRRLALGWSDLPPLARLSLYGFVLNKFAEFSGLALSTATDIALLITGETIFTALLAWLLLGERLRRATLAGLLLGALGVYIIVEGGLVAPQLGGGTRLLGDLLVIGALLFEALYTVRGKEQLARYPGLVVIASSIIGSLVVWVPATAVTVAYNGLPRLSLAAWGGVVYLAVGATVLAYLSWMVALRRVAASTASATLFVQPLLGTLLAIVLLGERPSWATLAGGLLIGGSVWVTRGA